MKEVVIRLNKLHSAQQQILNEAKRFNVLKCGRRFGKTELTKELAVQPMLDGDPVGYWTPTYKDVNKVWDELKFILSDLIESKDEQLKQLKLITGGRLDLWSLESPDNGRGFSYKRAIIDEAEKARHLKNAWEQTIRGTLADFSGDAWFMSTPKFGQTYFKTILFKNAEKFYDWMSWRFTSYDNPHLPLGEIDQIKEQQRDILTFKCEYLAEDVDITLRPFAYSYNDELHVDRREFDPNLELWLSFDFNVDPITCVSAQQGQAPENRLKENHEQELRFIKEFKLSNSNIYELCDVIISTYGFYNPVYVITGDATGRARSAMTSGTLNYYRVIKQKLGLSDLQIKVPSVNPAVADTRVLMNSLLQNYNVIIDPSCESLINDFKFVEVDDKGDIIKDRSSDTKKADLLDCARYMMNTFFKWFIKFN